jgi:hypothetical protein
MKAITLNIVIRKPKYKHRKNDRYQQKQQPGNAKKKLKTHRRVGE